MLTDDAIIKCTKYTFQPSNRQIKATESGKFKMKDTNVFVLPRVQKPKSRKRIMMEYMFMKEKEIEPKAVRQTTIMRFIAMLASGQQGIKNRVQYCLEVLVFENLQNLE